MGKKDFLFKLPFKTFFLITKNILWFLEEDLENVENSEEKKRKLGKNKLSQPYQSEITRHFIVGKILLLSMCHIPKM